MSRCWQEPGGWVPGYPRRVRIVTRSEDGPPVALILWSRALMETVV
jgi:hypothetical protein